MKLLAFHDVRGDLQAPCRTGLYTQAQELYNQAREAGRTQGSGRWEAEKATIPLCLGPLPQPCTHRELGSRCLSPTHHLGRSHLLVVSERIGEGCRVRS